jgi:putative RNA 2'-phosphotransferase
MTEKETKHTSKFLSLVLRHEPERIGLKLGDAGWVGVTELLEAVNRHGVALTLDQLKHVVATSDKKRFAFSDDGSQIRANQGHSVEVDLQYPPETPPEILHHGTATRFLDGIRQDGL